MNNRLALMILMSIATLSSVQAIFQCIPTDKKLLAEAIALQKASCPTTK